MQSDVEGVLPLREVVLQKGRMTRTVGATVYLRATPHTTREWTSRVLECHRAEVAAGVIPANADDSLAIAGTTESVTSTSTGFAVLIHGDDSATAAEILARARGLTPQVNRVAWSK